MGYSGKAVEGFTWQTILKVVSSLIVLAKISVLARLLTPNDFGLFSLTVITLGLSEAAAQTGINVTIIQSKRSLEYFVDTAWVISIVRGLIIAIMMVLMGFGLSRYFQQPELVMLVALTSAVPVIKGFINPSIVGMRKELRFFRDSVYQLSLVIVECLIAIGLGLWLKSVTAMLWSMIGAAMFEVVISHLLFELKPRFHYLKSRAQTIFENAKWLSVSSILGYLNDNLDDFVIGKIVGTAPLGIYHNAYSLTHKANYDLARSSQFGTLPILTKIMGDKTRLRSAMWRTVGSMILLMIATSIPLLLFPELIVNLILGDQWLAAVPLIKWLTLAGVTHSLALIGYTLFLAKGKYTPMNSHQVVNLVLTIGLIVFFGQQSGLEGAVFGLAMGRLLALPIVIYGAYQQLK